MKSSAETSAAPATGTADSSPVTEFYNAGLQKDYLFVGVTNNNVIEALLPPAAFANLQPLLLSHLVQFESRLRRLALMESIRRNQCVALGLWAPILEKSRLFQQTLEKGDCNSGFRVAIVLRRTTSESDSNKQFATAKY
jgi:hypothetical protein